jgi:hypothetical protein
MLAGFGNSIAFLKVPMPRVHLLLVKQTIWMKMNTEHC